MITLLLLASCGNLPQGKVTITEKLQNANEVTFRADIIASFPERVAEYTVDYTYKKDGSGELSILAPEILGGVSAKISSEDFTLSFDGVELSAGFLGKGEMSPLSSLPSLAEIWKSGSFGELSQSSHDGRKSTLAISKKTSELCELEYRTWFDDETAAPLYAEIFSDGERIIQCEFERTEYK